MLTDSFGRYHDYLRISLTERCNLRCTYCMPEEGVPLKPRADMLTFEEIVRIARLFTEAGVRKIRLTGGEPLVRKGVEELVETLGSLPGLTDLALTTNGLLLADRLPRLKAGGVTAVNISLDTLQEDRFFAITRRKGLDRVLAAVDAALAHGYSPVKVNCVVMRNTNEDEMTAFVEWTRHLPIEVRFIEYMPFAGNGWDTGQMVPFAEMKARVEDAFPGLAAVADAPNATSQTYAVPGFVGQVGFITSMTDAFCSSCNRLRITADGRLMVCLFGRSGVSLRDAMRDGTTDAELARLIGESVDRKKAAHAGMEVLAEDLDRPMILIGG